jgi:hypothetical protein
VARLLSTDQKEQIGNDPKFITKTLITGDESWVYGCKPDTKQRSSQWKTPHSPQHKKAQASEFNKSHLSIHQTLPLVIYFYFQK